MPITEPEPGKAATAIETIRTRLAALEQHVHGNALAIAEIEAARAALAVLEAALLPAPPVATPE